MNLGGVLATDDAVINRSVIGKDSAQEKTDVCFCPYCGTKINSDFIFCPKCGKKQNDN
ncbi:MAG: zinc-ribbon domain-containing protein [Methanomicrobium sp.]|nr:zinc-ribbon domain-containing protein [Methanomicrobium sp.]